MMEQVVDGVVYESFRVSGCTECVARPQYVTELCLKLGGSESSGAPNCIGCQWKVKNPLATLEDGTPVYLGDTVYHRSIDGGIVVTGVDKSGNLTCAGNTGNPSIISYDNYGLTKTPIIEVEPVKKPVVDGFGCDTKLLARINALKSGKKLMMKHEGYGTSHIFQMNPQRNVVYCRTADFSDGKIDSFILWGCGEWFILDEVEEEVEEVVIKKVKRQVEVAL